MMKSSDPIILISIHQPHLDAILDNKKYHEFRRKFANLKRFLLVFYVSSPIKAIRAIAEVDDVINGSIDLMCDIVKTHNYSSVKNIKQYFKGAKTCFAISLKNSARIPDITLADLKATLSNFVPPQSFIYLDKPKFKPIHDLILTSMKNLNSVLRSSSLNEFISLHEAQ